jgi:hypothetical protein
MLVVEVDPPTLVVHLALAVLEVEVREQLLLVQLV